MKTWRPITKALVLWTVAFGAVVAVVGIFILLDWTTKCQGLTGDELGLCQGGWSTVLGVFAIIAIGGIGLIGFAVLGAMWWTSRPSDWGVATDAALPRPIPGFGYATTPRRTVGYVIDGILVSIPFLLSRAVVGAQIGTNVAVQVALVLAALGYFVLSWRTWHATVGQHVVGLEVLEETSGGALTWRRAILLAFVINVWWIPSDFTALVPWLGSDAIALFSGAFAVALLVTTELNSSKQGLHDRWAHSVVVSNDEVPEAPPTAT